jgi:large subunit ribosomal protein L30
VPDAQSPAAASARDTAGAGTSNGAAPGAKALKLQLVRSIIGCTARQRATVEALGLKRMHQVVLQADSPATRGMVKRVAHLVRIVEE